MNDNDLIEPPHHLRKSCFIYPAPSYSIYYLATQHGTFAG